MSLAIYGSSETSVLASLTELKIEAPPSRSRCSHNAKYTEELSTRRQLCQYIFLRIRLML